ncbi:hypothetical protein K435DRAFT_860461 [Dendrothele bispora CBS 962.96]|uniref:Uncharacterized protein n=1 Tax=Dendrothele bispora (strain CBS 962.96) TaxID=1314807 RepID=A0A4S8LYF4_DENBC|nr:hypothetical protein K435DRAFT_860461 [Dendrothele bispora CBS 962.96]
MAQTGSDDKFTLTTPAKQANSVPNASAGNLGSAANYFQGDRVAVVRSINVLIAELVMGFGCSVPTQRDSSKFGDQRRVLINVDVGDFFGCWYAEVPRNIEGNSHPITTMEWLTRPGKWQDFAMKDPRIQTLISMRHRAESNGKGPKPVGLPSYVVRKMGDLREDVVPRGWEYLDSACRPFVKGTKTPKERELFYDLDSVPPRPWDSKALLALGAARRRRGRDTVRPNAREDLESPPSSPRSTSRGRRLRSHSISTESHHGSSRSPSPVAVRRSTHPRRHSRKSDTFRDSYQAGTPSRRSARIYAFSSPASRGREIHSRSRSPRAGPSSLPVRRCRNNTRSPSVEQYTQSASSSHRSSVGRQSNVVRTTRRFQKSNADRAVVNPYQATTPSPSGTSQISSRGSMFSSQASSITGKTSAKPSSSTSSISSLPALEAESDSDLPSMEELLHEFRPSYSVIALLWLENGGYAEEVLMDVTRGSTTLGRQKLALGRIGVEPDVAFQIFQSGNWRRILRADVLSAPRNKKVYLRAEGVTHGHKMPSPDVIEID